MEQVLQTNQRKLSQPTTTVSLKLPYLKQPTPMRYHREYKQPPKGKQFDLHTNNYTLPLYDPSKDKNLAYFFHKQSNRKIVEEIKERQRKSEKSRRRGKTERVEPEPRRSYQRKIMAEVSKGEFHSYLKEMRARVISQKE